MGLVYRCAQGKGVALARPLVAAQRPGIGLAQQLDMVLDDQP